MNKLSIDLNKKVVLITGGTRGIGKAIVETLAKANSIVIATATTEKGAETISQYLSSLGNSGTGMKLDVNDSAAVSELISTIGTKFGSIKILVNNSGITRDNLMLRMKHDEWHDVINTNLSSVMNLCQACLKGMIKARTGRIINISSVVGFTGNPGQANYAAAKAGMIGFAKSLAREVATRNINVNNIAPGFIQTDMTNALTDSQKETIVKDIPAGRLGYPQDIANAVLFLASDLSDYITGQTFHVNGGMYMS